MLYIKPFNTLSIQKNFYSHLERNTIMFFSIDFIFVVIPFKVHLVFLTPQCTLIRVDGLIPHTIDL